MATVAILGTCDTKLSELLYLREQILLHRGVDAIIIDVGRTSVSHELVDIPQSELIARYAPPSSNDKSPQFQEFSRSELIQYIAGCATKCVEQLHKRLKIHGIISAGGSGGTSLASTVMRNALPIGFPKLIVSTVASGDTGPIVEETDIMLMYSVVDIAGLNHVLRTVLRNAGAAIAGMASSYYAALGQKDHQVEQPKQRIGITMFGVTTPCVDTIRKHLKAHRRDAEIYVFHATGHGGRAMERLISEGQLDAVLDLTTTEICDFFTGGNMSAGPDRLEAAAKAGIPNVISLGATDMSNFGPRNTVPERYRMRLLYEHNPMVTLMRTSIEEAKKIGEFISEKLRTYAKRPEIVQVWIPKGSVSMLSTPGQPFADAKADIALFEALKEGLKETNIKIVEDDRGINDEGFAGDIAQGLLEVIELKR